MTASPTGDALAAVELADLAGERLLEVRRRLMDTGLTGVEVKDAGDAAAQEVLARALAQRFPDDAVLSEEAADDLQRLQADRVWIIDPLDGTREFSEPGRDDWAVHVALWQRGALTDAAVALPARGVTFSTAMTPAVDTSGQDGALRLAVSRSRPPAFVTSLAERIGAELVAMGSAGVKAMSVLTGETDAYVHAGGQYEWDSAAPVAVARAAGLATSRLDGSPLTYNNANPYLPDLVICRAQVHDMLLQQIAGLQP
ncbi:MAG: 3'(2'),5'-bisphosphate nucleotidase CysQ [Ornithinimicrobium sp.]